MKFKTSHLLVLLILSISSCNINENILFDTVENNEITYSANNDIHIVKKLDNPYSTKNMKIAYNKLKKDGLLRSEIIINTTHLYVRFLPKDKNELEILYNDKNLTLFSYPLDCELTEGDTYKDSTLINNSFSWLYTRVPVDFKSPIKNMEILDSLFLPYITESNENNQSRAPKRISINEWKNLENQSLILTNNKTESNSSFLRSGWIPSARIKVYDDVKCTNIAIEGVIVRARKWFNWESSITNDQGYAQMSDNFSGNVSYSIAWERDDWDIRSGDYGQAFYNGPSIDYEWNLVIERESTSKNYLYAHIHRACFTYWFENNNYGIKIPFHDSFLTKKVKILAHDEAGVSYSKLNSNEIILYRSQSEIVNISCSHIFHSTIHELAHISHSDLINNDFNEIEAKVYEGWATGVSFLIAKDFFPMNSLFYGNWQNITFDDIINNHQSIYTPIVIDLIDDYNQRTEHSYQSSSYPNDRVSGYTLNQIENSLIGVKTLTEWKNKLKSLYNNQTDIYLNELFEQYINL